MASSYSVSASTQQQPVQSLRDLQRKALLKLLNLNSEEEEQNAQPNDLLPQVANGEPVWKFLVFDKLGQDIISSVLKSK